MATIGSTLADQYERAFDMLKENIESLTDEQWTSEAVNVPARWAFHAAQGSKSYNRISKEDPFPWGSPNWEGEADQLPDRIALLDYVETLRGEVRDRLTTKPDEWFLEPTSFLWTGQNRLAQYVYSLRHFTHHAGEVSMALRLLGADETAWR